MTGAGGHAGRGMQRFAVQGSLMRALTRSLLLGLTMLWIVGVVGGGFVLQRLIDTRADEELRETGAILLSFIRHSDDLLVVAAAMGDVQFPGAGAPHGHRFAYRVLDARGTVLLRSADATMGAPPDGLREGFSDDGVWRIVTLADQPTGRWLQLADLVSERRDALVGAVLWLTAPLALLLAFAALMVLRASRSLMKHVRRTALAVTEQDPQKLGMLPLTGVVTEMRPAVEATNRLLSRVTHALEAERSFTYNSAHEMRTPIAAALAQAQLLVGDCTTPEQKLQAERLVDSLTRLSRLAERLLALARAEGDEPLQQESVDLGRVAQLVADEFRHDPRLSGRDLTVTGASIRVQGDVDAVGLALRNLIENALVHGQGGSWILVFSGLVDGAPGLVVTDDGPGVDATELPTLTRRFARGKGAGGTGAGLGLSIVSILARRLGARLSLHSPPRGRPQGLEAQLLWSRASAAAPPRH